MRLATLAMRSAISFIILAVFPLAALAGGFEGRVTSEAGAPVVGAMVTFRFHDPFQERTVFSGEDGSYNVAGLPTGTSYTIRVRRIGWHDVRVLR